MPVETQAPPFAPAENTGGEDLAALLSVGKTEGSESTTPASQVVDPNATVQLPNRDAQGRFLSQGEQPAQTAAVETPPAQADTFSTVDPNTLPPELQETYKSLQADYTRKTQAVAEQRRQFESFGDPAIVREALDLHSTLRDPGSWQALHSELTAGLQSLGLSPAEAAGEANRQLEQTAQQQGANLDELDPELAPLANAYKGLQAELDTLKQQQAYRDQTENEQRYQMALVGEWQRQQNVISQANPTYTQADYDAITELASFYEGNLLDAQGRWEELKQGTIGNYLAQKEGASSGASMPGAGVISNQPPQISSFDDAKKLSIEVEEMLKNQ